MANEELPPIPPITFTAAGDSPEAQQANLEIVMPSPGFPTAAQIIAEAIEKRVDLALLDYTQQAVAIRFQIDGIWHTMPVMDRGTGDYMLATLKQLAGLDYRDLRSRQEGEFKAEYMRKKYKCRVVTQGVATGERVAFYPGVPKPPLDSLEDLGMRSKMREKLTPMLNTTEPGLLISSAMPGEGYSTGWRGFLSGCDRFMRDFYVMEETSRTEEEVINITPVLYDESKGENAFTPIPQLLLKEPNVIAFSEMANGAILDQMIDLSNEQNMPIMSRILGKSAIDSLLRLLALNSDRDKLLASLRGIVCMRLIRTLCETCKLGFVPNPAMLQQLGLPPGRVAKLYREFQYQPGMVDENNDEIPPCPNCHGLGYVGRTGFFELLTITDQLRQVIAKTPRFDHILAAAQSGGHITLQQEGIVLVAKGGVSLEELQRVLKK